jgi:hypothetical protein
MSHYFPPQLPTASAAPLLVDKQHTEQVELEMVELMVR